MSFLKQIDKTWTLFLDRDGVINHEKDQDYIRHHDEFVFYDGALEAIKKFSDRFGLILLATNQRGIGRGFMTHEQLHSIHQHMLSKIEQSGGRIDEIYYAPDLDSDAHHRKPNTGMGLQAKTEFPQIDFSKSVMVGNNFSDMDFGKRLGMKTVFVETTKKIDDEHEWVDIKTDNLSSFAKML